jgi:asparagine synthase (glutamine-hydrolysing)
MCGIAGWVDFERDLSREREVMQRMADTLACRGPDAQGFFLSRDAAFAHRRLAVIDLEGGKQPMERALATDAPCALTYSGEIYNFVELRDELGKLGHTFETRSDTEVLLRAYMQWGAACVDRLNGMFAFGIWDGARRELFLARDRLGIKPLFYAVRGSTLVFGSEPKALLAHPDIASEIGDEGLAELLVMGPLRTPGRGVFRGVDELRPAFTLRKSREGVRVARYWQLESRPHEDDLDTTTKKIRALLDDIVQRQLVSDVPVCTLLSGGLDSSAVTALAARTRAREGRGPISTYSVELRDADRYFVASDIQPSLDAPWVDRVVSSFGTDHRKVILDTRDLVEHFDAPLAARDLPSLGEMDISLLLLFREIKKRHTVAVSGESADEVFGGYPWFHSEDAIASDDFPWSQTMGDAVSILSPELEARLRPAEYARERYRDAIAETPRLPGESPRERRMREILYLNQTRFLLMLLDRKDRISMRVGLEVRVPFCDHRLVEYAWNIPWEMKSFGGREKGILRRALEGVLPEDLRWRKKSAYPSMANPTYAEAVKKKLEAIVADPSAPLRAVVDVGKVKASLASASAENTALPFGGPVRQWAYLVQVDAWFRRYRVRIVSA